MRSVYVYKKEQTSLMFSTPDGVVCMHLLQRRHQPFRLQWLEPVFKHSLFRPFRHMEPFPFFPALLAALPLQFQKLSLFNHGRSCHSWEAWQGCVIVLIGWIPESQRLNEVLWCVIMFSNGYLLSALVPYSAWIYCILHSLAVNNIWHIAQFVDQLNEVTVKMFKNLFLF